MNIIATLWEFVGVYGFIVEATYNFVIFLGRKGREKKRNRKKTRLTDKSNVLMHIRI